MFGQILWWLSPKHLEGLNFPKSRRGSPVDNRPSTEYFHHFVQKKKEKKKEKQVTSDMWHVTLDMWHVTHDMWHVVEGEHSLKISAS